LQIQLSSKFHFKKSSHASTTDSFEPFYQETTNKDQRSLVLGHSLSLLE